MKVISASDAVAAAAAASMRAVVGCLSSALGWLLMHVIRAAADGPTARESIDSQFITSLWHVLLYVRRPWHHDSWHLRCAVHHVSVRCIVQSLRGLYDRAADCSFCTGPAR